MNHSGMKQDVTIQNIVGKYGVQVTNALKKASTLDIQCFVHCMDLSGMKILANGRTYCMLGIL